MLLLGNFFPEADPKKCFKKNITSQWCLWVMSAAEGYSERWADILSYQRPKGQQTRSSGGWSGGYIDGILHIIHPRCLLYENWKLNMIVIQRFLWVLSYVAFFHSCKPFIYGPCEVLRQLRSQVPRISLPTPFPLDFALMIVRSLKLSLI